MKKTVLFSFILFTVNSFAQTTNIIKLSKGQTIAAKTAMTTDMDLGMGTMKTDNNIISKIQVIDENAKFYTITTTVTKMKMSVDGMGQSMSYDSDKPEDSNTEIGKTAGEKINVPDTLLLNKFTGEVTPFNNNKKEEKSGNGMLAFSNNQNQSTSDAFLIIPANSKIGDSWIDSTVTKGMTTKKTFKWISTDKDIATIKVTGAMYGSTEQEMQGASITMGLDLNFTETRTVNIKNGQVIKVMNDGDMKMTMESMGMTMSSKIITNTEYSN